MPFSGVVPWNPMGIQTSTPTRDVTFHARLLFQIVQCFGSIAGVQDGADIRPDPTHTEKKNGPRTRGTQLSSQEMVESWRNFIYFFGGGQHLWFIAAFGSTFLIFGDVQRVLGNGRFTQILQHDWISVPVLVLEIIRRVLCLERKTHWTLNYLFVIPSSHVCLSHVHVGLVQFDWQNRTPQGALYHMHEIYIYMNTYHI